MRRGPLRAAASAVAALVAATALFPEAIGIWVTGGSVIVLGVAVGSAVAHARGLRAEGPSPFAALTPADAPVSSPADLKALERTLGWQRYSAEDFHHRVAPVLTRIVTSRLKRRGIDAHAQPELARATAGPALGVLLDPAENRDEVVDTAAIARMVDAIEAL